jgi:hypothetical protein
VNFTWEELATEDPMGGITGMLLYAFFASIGLLTFILLSESEYVFPKSF